MMQRQPAMNRMIMLLFRKTLILSFLVSSIFACKDKSPELPLEKHKLVELMTDIYVAESMASHADLSVRDSVHGLYIQQVSIRHKMTIDEINQVMKKLTEMPDSLYLIQGIAIDSLSARQSREQEKERKI